MEFDWEKRIGQFFFVRNFILPTANAGMPETQNLYGKMYWHFYPQTSILLGILK